MTVPELGVFPLGVLASWRFKEVPPVSAISRAQPSILQLTPFRNLSERLDGRAGDELPVVAERDVDVHLQALE